eukprot:CFRG6097T1
MLKASMQAPMQNTMKTPIQMAKFRKKAKKKPKKELVARVDISPDDVNRNLIAKAEDVPTSNFINDKQSDLSRHLSTTCDCEKESFCNDEKEPSLENDAHMTENVVDNVFLPSSDQMVEQTTDNYDNENVEESNVNSHQPEEEVHNSPRNGYMLTEEMTYPPQHDAVKSKDLSNVAYTLPESVLKELLQSNEGFVDFRLCKNHDGTSQGYGFCTMDSESAAQLMMLRLPSVVPHFVNTREAPEDTTMSHGELAELSLLWLKYSRCMASGNAFVPDMTGMYYTSDEHGYMTTSFPGDLAIPHPQNEPPPQYTNPASVPLNQGVGIFPGYDCIDPGMQFYHPQYPPPNVSYEQTASNFSPLLEQARMRYATSNRKIKDILKFLDKEKASQEQQPPFTLIITNIPNTYTEVDLMKMFAFWPVLDTKIERDRVTHRSKAYGYITMSSERHIREAIARYNNKTIHGQLIHLQPASSHLSHPWHT